MSLIVNLVPLLVAAGLPEPETEFRFATLARWRFDYAWPAYLVSLEREGGDIYRGRSRHARGTGFEADIAKYNHAACLGWCVIRATAGQMESGLYLTWLRCALVQRGWNP